MSKLNQSATVAEASAIPPMMHVYAWEERFLYLGPSARTSPHRNHAATWLVAHRGTLKVTLGSGEVLQNEVIYVPSEIEFSTDADAPLIAALYWEPESESFARATTQFDVSTPRAFQCRYGKAGELASLYQPHATLADADAVLAQIFALPELGRAESALADTRIAEALHILREAPHEYENIESLAERVHLSPSRFQHVFREEVGVPVRRYVLWMKMRRALELAMAGDSLTRAALSSGFSDAAHLSRTVRQIMGIAPEFLFRHRQQLIVHH
jgi:AraC-like DNA-binding protein